MEGILLIRIFTLILAMLYRNSKFAVHRQKTALSEWLAVLLIPLTAIAAESMIAGMASDAESRTAVLAVLIVCMNVMAFYLYDSRARKQTEKAEKTLLKRENLLYSRQFEMLQESDRELRTFRHDLKNRLIGVRRLIQTGCYDEADRLLHRMTGDLNAGRLYSSTGNLAVDSIINYKLQSAEQDGIAVNAEIAVPHDLEMDSADLISMLGNLLDNALTALADVPQEKRTLQIRMTDSRNRLLLHISNPFCGEIPLENGEIVSSHKDRRNHGFGLKSIRRTVEKYDGCITIKHTDHIFTVDILLYLT